MESVPSYSQRCVIYILRRPDNTFLMQLRDDKAPTFPNMWCFPGGGCDEGENYESALIREIKEETDLDLSISECHLFITQHSDNHHIYVCDATFDHEPQVLEGADMQWMTIDEIKKLKLAFSHKEIVTALETYLNTN